MSDATIAAGWAEYLRDVLRNPDLSPEAMGLLERTFYAGALVVLKSLDEAESSALIDEVETFVDQLIAGLVTPEGAP